ncbi:DNA-binding response regulator, partial [Kibdelosporangium lantanae]
QETAAATAWIVRSRPVVRAMTGLFGTAWANALRHDTRTVDVSSPYTEHLLRSLYSGLPDETAAAEIGLSVRTYRRHVAALLRDMGVTSRFQAGVRAHEFGLLHG